MMEIYAVKIRGKSDIQHISRFINHLSVEKQEGIKKFRRQEDALRTVIGDILVRINACSKLGIVNKDIIYEKNEYGKPYIKGYNKFCFSISHSYEWVVCAINDFPLGIDIERIKPIDLKVAERIYSKHEVSEMEKRDIPLRLAFFYDLWTLRESYVKAIGTGFHLPFDSFSFKFYDENRVELVTNKRSDDYYFRKYNIDDNYRMAVCSQTDDFPVDIIYKNLDETFDKPLLMGK